MPELYVLVSPRAERDFTGGNTLAHGSRLVTADLEVVATEQKLSTSPCTILDSSGDMPNKRNSTCTSHNIQRDRIIEQSESFTLIVRSHPAAERDHPGMEEMNALFSSEIPSRPMEFLTGVALDGSLINLAIRRSAS